METQTLQNTQKEIQPKFLIMTSTTTEFKKLSPFLIHKAIQGIAGSVANVKKLKSGDLFIETSTADQSKNLLNCKCMANVPVSVSPHSSLNSSKGVISETDLIGVDEAEILSELSNQGVTAVYRISMRRDGQIINTKHLILTFNTPQRPSEIKAGYLNCKVKTYFPPPIRCFKCQHYGHSKATCRGNTHCAKCSGDHNEENCTSTTIMCMHCKGDHTTFSKNCPKWKEEKTIIEIKVKNNISYGEAKQTYLHQKPQIFHGKIIPSAQKPVMIDASTQTFIPGTSRPTSTSDKSQGATRKTLHDQGRRKPKPIETIRSKKIKKIESVKGKIRSKLKASDFLKHRPNSKDNDFSTYEEYSSAMEDEPIITIPTQNAFKSLENNSIDVPTTSSEHKKKSK